jgi:hypothetical protein
MPKNVKKPNPYPAKPKPSAAASRVEHNKGVSYPPLRRLVQEALDGLSRPGVIPSLVLQTAVEAAYQIGVQMGREADLKRKKP